MELDNGDQLKCSYCLLLWVHQWLHSLPWDSALWSSWPHYSIWSGHPSLRAGEKKWAKRKKLSVAKRWHPTPVLLPGKSHGRRSLVGCGVHRVAESWTRLSYFTLTFHFHALEKEMATHSSVVAWRILGTAEPGGLPSMGSHRVGHDWSDLAAAAAAAR